MLRDKEADMILKDRKRLEAEERKRKEQLRAAKEAERQLEQAKRDLERKKELLRQQKRKIQSEQAEGRRARAALDTADRKEGSRRETFVARR